MKKNQGNSYKMRFLPAYVTDTFTHKKFESSMKIPNRFTSLWGALV